MEGELLPSIAELCIAERPSDLSRSLSVKDEGEAPLAYTIRCHNYGRRLPEAVCSGITSRLLAADFDTGNVRFWPRMTVDYGEQLTLAETAVGRNRSRLTSACQTRSYVERLRRTSTRISAVKLT